MEGLSGRAAISDERLPLTCRVLSWIASLRKAEQRRGVAGHSRGPQAGLGPRTLLLSLKLGPRQLLPAASHLKAGLSFCAPSISWVSVSLSLRNCCACHWESRVSGVGPKQSETPIAQTPKCIPSGGRFSVILKEHQLSGHLFHYLSSFFCGFVFLTNERNLILRIS